MTTSKKPSRTDVLVQAAMAASACRLEIDYYEGEQYERLIRSARQFRKLPDGKELRLEKNWRERKAWVVLEDQPAWQRAVLAPVTVPEQLRKPSDVVINLRNRADFRIRQAEKTRALRLIEALVSESRRRGYRAEATRAPRTDRWGYTDTDKEHGHIAITINGYEYRLTMAQEQDRVKHIPTKTEESRGWFPRYDHVAIAAVTSLHCEERNRKVNRSRGRPGHLHLGYMANAEILPGRRAVLLRALIWQVVARYTDRLTQSRDEPRH